MLSQASDYSPKFISFNSPENPVHGTVPTEQQTKTNSRHGLVPLLAGIAYISTAGNLCDISEFLPKQTANTSNNYGYFQYREIQNQVAILKSQMHFNNSDLARIIGVTRQAVHDWLNGQQISINNQERLNALRNIAFELQKHEVDISSHTFLRTFGPDKLSLASAIQSGDNPKALLEIIIKTVKFENRNREKLNSILSSRNTPPKDMKELITPSLSES